MTATVWAKIAPTTTTKKKNSSAISADSADAGSESEDQTLGKLSSLPPEPDPANKPERRSFGDSAARTMPMQKSVEPRKVEEHFGLCMGSIETRMGSALAAAGAAGTQSQRTEPPFWQVNERKQKRANEQMRIKTKRKCSGEIIYIRAR